MNEILFKTLMLSAEAASKVDEVHIQLSILQRQCNYRDRPLCDTLKVKSFDEMGFIEKLKIVSPFDKLYFCKNFCKILIDFFLNTAQRE